MGKNRGILVQVLEGEYEGKILAAYHADQETKFQQAKKLCVTVGTKKVLKDFKKLKHIGYVD